ncbi:hypothetical protein HZH68_003812 [Vespula germanica]|uniref:Uncharacterized protein n=1 Tax=Vespula germanica TaxID=30212 RepID=A0A834KME9_VESGE|nr:hypothetical protein HZH68_003812 [Vespula germanica]
MAREIGNSPISSSYSQNRSHLRLKGLALRVEVAVIGQTEECCQDSIRIIAWSLKGFGLLIPSRSVYKPKHFLFETIVPLSNRARRYKTALDGFNYSALERRSGCRCNRDMVPVALAEVAAATAAAAAVSSSTAST